MKMLLALAVMAVIGFVAFTFLGKGIEVSQVWTPASNGATTATASAMVYMTIDNKGDTNDSLVAVQTEVATHASIREETDANGTKTSTEVKSLEVASNRNRVLKPAGTYILLGGLKKPLIKGDSFVLSLVFDKKGLVENSVSIEDDTAVAYVK